MNRPTDLAVIAVASNNLAVLNRDQNLFDSRKRIKTASAPETEPKLNSFQKKIIQVNEALLAIYTGQVRQKKMFFFHLSIIFSTKQRVEFSTQWFKNLMIPTKQFHWPKFRYLSKRKNLSMQHNCYK